jgi:uncharacterized membrane protein
MNKNRIDSFSDGVIAIIITIMVLEMKTPHEATWKAIIDLLPVLISYAFSYTFVAIYWGNHHHLLHTLPKATSNAIWANLTFLFFLSLIPFTTAWMGETHFGKIPVFFYALNLIFTAISYFILQQVIIKSWKHETQLMTALKKQEKKGIYSLVIYLIALAFALFIPLISAVCFVVVSILWLIPDKNIEKALNEN